MPEQIKAILKIEFGIPAQMQCKQIRFIELPAAKSKFDSLAGNIDGIGRQLLEQRFIRFSAAADERRKPKDQARIAVTRHDGSRYLMLRFRPQLKGKPQREKRNWIFLFESSGDRDPMLARVQIDVIKTILKNAEHDDTFALVTAGTRASLFADEPRPCTAAHADQALSFLEETHLVGAFDFGSALSACKPFFSNPGETYLVHVGSGVPVLGEKREEKLLQRVPQTVRYVGVGVGHRWSRSFMKAAASRTGGYFTQINPDEQVGWRAFELLSNLNAPRLLDLGVTDERQKLTFLNYVNSLSQGEELCALKGCGFARSAS